MFEDNSTINFPPLITFSTNIQTLYANRYDNPFRYRFHLTRQFSANRIESCDFHYVFVLGFDVYQLSE